MAKMISLGASLARPEQAIGLPHAGLAHGELERLLRRGRVGQPLGVEARPGPQRFEGEALHAGFGQRPEDQVAQVLASLAGGRVLDEVERHSSSERERPAARLAMTLNTTELYEPLPQAGAPAAERGRAAEPW